MHVLATREVNTVGDKGARSSASGAAMAERLCDGLVLLGDVTTRKMFGGHGVFAHGDMFALVDSAGNPFLRADEMTSGRFEAAGSARHSGMPYWSIPPAVLDDDDDLVAWARIALGVARAAKKQGKRGRRG